MTGRKTLFTDELADAICDRLINGESLRDIGRDPTMPSPGTICRWLGEEDKTAFREQYARAREAQAETHVDEIIAIADDGSNDWMEKHHGDSVSWVENGESIRRSHERIEARKWVSGKMAAKKYGDRVVRQLVGPNDGPIQTQEVSAFDSIESQLARLASRETGNTQKPQ